MEFNTIIVRYGEMSTKGKNKKDFINRLASSINKALIKFQDDYKLVKRHDHIYIYLNKEIKDIVKILKEVPGMYSFSLAYLLEDPELDNLLNKTLTISLISLFK